MKSFSSRQSMSRSLVGILCLFVGALCVATSCNQNNRTVVYEDEDLIVKTTSAPVEADVPDAETDVAAPASGQPASEPVTQEPALPESQPEAPRPVAPPKFDEKGVSVDLSECGEFNGFVNDEDKARQAKLKVVRGTGPITVAGLQTFAALPELVEFLWLDAQLPEGPEAEAAFNAFAAAPKLRKVRMTGLKLESGAFPRYALTALSKSANLADLDISGSAVEASDLASVDYAAGFRKLVKLNLYQTKTGDAGVEAVLPLADRLNWLNFDDTGLTQASVANLAKFTNLTFLHVGRSALEDAAVDFLAQLTKLEKIHVTRSKMTEEGADKLRAALQGCEVVSQPEN